MSTSVVSAVQVRSRGPRKVLRRGTAEQGRALEMLGHAVEYLVDSRLRLGTSEYSDELAVQILMRLSREVFAECPEIVPLRTRAGNWLRRLFWPRRSLRW